MTFTVDIHHHMLPDFFWQATNEGDHPVGGIAPPPWSPASTLSFLDDAGIDVTWSRYILSYTIRPWPSKYRLTSRA